MLQQSTSTGIISFLVPAARSCCFLFVPLTLLLAIGHNLITHHQSGTCQNKSSPEIKPRIPIYNRPQGNCVRINRVRSLTIPKEVDGGIFCECFFRLATHYNSRSGNSINSARALLCASLKDWHSPAVMNQVF